MSDKRETGRGPAAGQGGASGFVLTGRHVLAIALAAFGTIIAVNLVLAVNAVRSFPGLEVANSYVASQNFDREREAQLALGWSVQPRYDGRELVLRIADADGLPVAVRSLAVTVSRPTQKRDDVTPEMRYEAGEWRASLDLAPGAWVVHLTAEAEDGTLFRQRLQGFEGALVRG